MRWHARTLSPLAAGLRSGFISFAGRRFIRGLRLFFPGLFPGAFTGRRLFFRCFGSIVDLHHPHGIAEGLPLFRRHHAEEGH
ncbi:hypothetical protein AOB60_38940 [Streptomyces noursei]|uniref:Uncharacterized protein n=1 Tax=Streptomyces noursei TaxID=1971 RepID=A0A2N8P538_STRNR|nr:hypothetical protein AOB60_38940 [Streptomyces noursei]